MREILSQRGFSESEIVVLEAREDYLEVRERVERLQADQLLDQLQARTEAHVESIEENLITRWENFKNDVLAITAPERETSTHETLEEMRARLESEAQENITQMIEQRVGWVPLIGWAIAEWLSGQATELISQNSEEEKWFFSGIKRWFILLIAWFFGMNSAFEEFEWAVSSARNATLPELVVPGRATWEDSLDVIDEWNIENLNLTNFRYNTWLNTLIFFSNGRNIENDSNIRNRIFEKIKTLSLWEVSDLDSNNERQREIFWSELDRPWFTEWLQVLLPSFKNTQFLEVCELSLWWNRIENLLSPNWVENSQLFNILWEQRSREIIHLSNETWFNISSLTMYELSILYSASFPSLAYRWIAASIALWVESIDLAQNEMQEIINSSAPWKILTYLLANGDGISLLRNDSWFLEELSEEHPEIDIREIEAIIEFKNYVLNDFHSNPALRLSGETLNAFNGNLNYTRIIILYDILKGKSVEEVNPLSFPLLILAISEIISGNSTRNSGLAEQYKWQFIRNWVIEFLWRDNLSESERRAFEIYWSAFLMAWWRLYVEQIYRGTQFAEWFTWISNEAVFSWSAGIALTWRLVARQWLLRTSPGLLRIGWGLSRVWWWWMILYWGILGYEYYSGSEEEWQTQTPDLPTLDNEDYIGNRIDRDLEWAETPWEQMQILSRLRESTHEYMIGDESIIIITYPWDIPHAVYQGRIWTFQTLNRDNLAWDIEWHLINTIRWLTEDQELDDNTVWTDWNKIYIWPSAQNSYWFTLDELFVENRWTMGVETVRDLEWAFRRFLDEQFPWHWYEWGQELWQYMPIIFLPWSNNTFLWLIAEPIQSHSTPVS